MLHLYFYSLHDITQQCKDNCIRHVQELQEGPIYKRQVIEVSKREHATMACEELCNIVSPYVLFPLKQMHRSTIFSINVECCSGEWEAEGKMIN